MCSAHAEKSDRDKPLKIEADKLDYDDLQQISVFSGKVSLVKGTIDMRGERLEVRQDPDGYQYAVFTPLAGERATYRQKRDIPNESVEGLAQRIEYDGRVDKIILTGSAELRRLRNAQVTDEMSGQRIVYENLSDRFSVEGKIPVNSNASTAPSSAGASQRVRAVLSPRKAQESKP